MNSCKPIRLGIIGSSGGSALAAANECITAACTRVEWVVITDRQCGLEKWARTQAKELHVIDYSTMGDFSCKAFAIFDSAGCDDVLLFYTRQIGVELIERKRVWNIHPSILPAFPGLHGVRDTMAYGARLLGATLHRVNLDLDSGEILAQVCAPLSSDLDQLQAHYLSYLQKVWLTLLLIDQLTSTPDSPKLNSCKFNSCGPGVVVSSPGFSSKMLWTSYANWLENNNHLKND